MPAVNNSHAMDRGRGREAQKRIYLRMADALLEALETYEPPDRPARVRPVRGAATSAAHAPAAPRKAGKAALP